MRKSLISLASLLLLLLTSVAAFAQVRGTGRLQGTVLDKNTNKPVAGVKITLTLRGGQTQPIVTKTDARGKWGAIGMVGGTWDVDFEAAGYQTLRRSTPISEINRLPPFTEYLVPEEKQVEAAATVEATAAVPKAAVDAINAGQDLLKIKAGDVITTTESTSHTVTEDEVKENAKKAAVEFEKALPQIPDTSADLQSTRRQLQQILAQAYYKAGDLPSAIKNLEAVTASDPWTTPDAGQVGREMLLANLYLEAGELDKGKAILEKLPATAITDPLVYTNLGILFLNKRKPQDGFDYFDKAVKLDPTKAESYYYRALALIQLKKNAEAKADLEKVLQLAPDSPEAKDAQALIAGFR